MATTTASSSAMGRRSSTAWSPSILSTPTTADSRSFSRAYSRAWARPGSLRGGRRRVAAAGPLARAAQVARRGVAVRAPPSPGPPPPGRHGRRPPLSPKAESDSTKGKRRAGEKPKKERLTVIDTKGSGDAQSVGYEQSLVMRLSRDTRDADLRRRCRAVVALEPYRSAVTIFSPEGECAYRQLKERVMRAVGKSLESGKDACLTLPVVDKQALDRFLELQDDVEAEGLIDKDAMNAVFKDMDEKMRSLSPLKERPVSPSRQASALAKMKNRKTSGDSKRPPRASGSGTGLIRRRVHFHKKESLISDESDAEAPKLTIKELYTKELKKWKIKHRKKLGLKPKYSAEELKTSSLTPSTVSSSVRRRSPAKIKKRPNRATSSPNMMEDKTGNKMSIAFLYEGNDRNTSSSEEDRERRKLKWKRQ